MGIAVRQKGGRVVCRIVLGLCDQGSLQAAIDEGAYRCSGNSFEGHPDVARVLGTATEVASAMEYLHSKVSCPFPLPPQRLCPARFDSRPAIHGFRPAAGGLSAILTADASSSRGAHAGTCSSSTVARAACT